MRAIGVSNFSVKKLEALLAATAGGRHTVSALQVEAHPYWRNDALAAFCEARSIHFSAYSALGSRHTAGKPAAHEAQGHELVDDPAVRDVARRVGKPVQAVLLRWALQRRPGGSAIFKSTSAEHIKADADVTGWALSDEDMGTLSSLPQRRMLSGKIFLSEEGPYKTLEELWDEQADPEQATKAA